MWSEGEKMSKIREMGLWWLIPELKKKGKT